MPQIDRGGDRGDGIDGDNRNECFRLFLTSAVRLASIALAGNGRRVNRTDVDDIAQAAYLKLRTRVSNKWGDHPDPDLIIAGAFEPDPSDKERSEWVLTRLDHVVGEAVMEVLCKRLRNQDGVRVYVPRHPNIEPATASRRAEAAPSSRHDEGDALLGTPGLTPRQRVILKGRLDDLTHGQIAAQIGVGVDTVKGEWATIKHILAASIRTRS